MNDRQRILSVRKELDQKVCNERQKDGERKKESTEEDIIQRFNNACWYAPSRRPMDLPYGNTIQINLRVFLFSRCRQAERKGCKFARELVVGTGPSSERLPACGCFRRWRLWYRSLIACRFGTSLAHTLLLHHNISYQLLFEAKSKNYLLKQVDPSNLIFWFFWLQVQSYLKPIVHTILDITYFC